MTSFCDFLFQKAVENTSHFLHYAFFVFSGVCKSGSLDEATTDTLLIHATAAIQQTRSHLDCCASLSFLKEAFRRFRVHVSDERIGFLVTLWGAIRELPDFQSCVDYLANIFFLISDRISEEFMAEVLEAFPPLSERCLTSEMCSLLIDYFAVERTARVRIAGAKAIVRLVSAGKAIRYCHRIELPELLEMIRLGVDLMRSLDGGEELIAEVLPGRQRAHEIVCEWFGQIANGRSGA
jgi:hypothetical protein